MSVTVTIHNGEMGQIKHFIDEKNKKGQLYGLWTHSNQPVIQYVTGAVKEHEKEKIGSYLLNNHGLKHVGNWSTSKFGKESNFQCLNSLPWHFLFGGRCGQQTLSSLKQTQSSTATDGHEVTRILAWTVAYFTAPSNRDFRECLAPCTQDRTEERNTKAFGNCPIRPRTTLTPTHPERTCCCF